MKRLALLCAFLLTTSHALAWGEAGHLMSNEAATLGLPADMPHFFHGAYPQLVWLGYEPDRWKGSGDSADADNNPEHFVDYEYLAGLELPRDRYEFIALMERSGRLRQKGITNSESGFVIWRIAELSEQLTGQFRQWRNSSLEPSARTSLEQSIINTAGLLGHYVADAANPHHSTLNFNGWVLANPNGYATDCGTHSRFESTYVSHAVSLNDITARLRPAQIRTDYFQTAIDQIEASNALTEKIYQLDRDGAFDIFRPTSAEGLDFAADRLAAGSSMLRDLWWSAWKNSEQRRRRE
jgi:hypothetical protein